MFICVRGLDVSSASGSQIAHKLMKMTQKAAYTMVRISVPSCNFEPFVCLRAQCSFGREPYYLYAVVLLLC